MSIEPKTRRIRRPEKTYLRGDRLAAVRRAKRLSQPKLGALLGMSHSAINMLEHGHSDPSCKILIELCRELNVSADWLLGLSDKAEPIIPNGEPRIWS